MVDTRKTGGDLEIEILILQGESHAQSRWCWILHGSSTDPPSGLHRHRYCVTMGAGHSHISLLAGSYVCSYNDSQDRSSPESNTEVYIFVFDEINLLTNSGFDFQQSVAYKSAQIPCRWFFAYIGISCYCMFSDRLTPTFLSASPCRGRGRLIWRMNSSNLIRRWEKGRYAQWRRDIFIISKTVN